MSFKSTDMNVTDDGTGASATEVALVPADEFTMFITGTGTWTVQLEISVDGVNWLAEGSALTAAGTVKSTKPALFARTNTTVWSSGTPAAQLLHGQA